jgi:TfoX/Sxy family transcriptional regulator of competence genes
MFGSSGLKAAGKVFAMVVKGRLVAKLLPSEFRSWTGAVRESILIQDTGGS